jgi:hypothetical protein
MLGVRDERQLQVEQRAVTSLDSPPLVPQEQLWPGERGDLCWRQVVIVGD